ncbi:Plasmid stabilization system protein ParE [Rhizobium sp. NFR07]|uniref:type II toxin-antitoxin system RelE/ParE family toxin n=1 Tax=Rhizobium sp. NFR07 TaxID=1566262 RepID=UPI0008E42E9E|nr:type II toxin-antitoxin system RelE/ParE family toxin [Rhizobium sp. NFR07]SFB03677.1 Plasmid stabilization system protein ParE [Rhizobium sp. NFR07]
MIVVFSTASRTDLDRIWSYIASDNPRRAITFVRQIVAQSKRLADMPRRYALIQGRETTGIRRMPYGNYLVFYRLGDRGVEILRILGAAQDHEAILFPDETPDR